MSHDLRCAVRQFRSCIAAINRVKNIGQKEICLIDVLPIHMIISEDLNSSKCSFYTLSPAQRTQPVDVNNLTCLFLLFTLIKHNVANSLSNACLYLTKFDKNK